MLHAEINIDNQQFKNWVLNWDENEFVDWNKKFLKKNVLDKFSTDFVKSIKSFVQTLDKQDCYYYEIAPSLSKALERCYFLKDETTINVANYYEILLLPADIFTKQSLISGYDRDIKNFGKIDITINGEIIGNIGQISDLAFGIFYEKFVKESTTEIDMEDETYYFDNTDFINDHDSFLSLQIWKNPGDANINELLDKIIYECSVNLNLFFKKPQFDKLPTGKGQNKVFDLQYNSKQLDKIPLMYFNSARYNSSERMIFLSYYQVIEFYYIKANYLQLQKSMIDSNIVDIQNVDFEKVEKGIKEYSNNQTEKKAIKLVLHEAINFNGFVIWLNKEKGRLQYFTKGNNQFPSIIALDIRDENKTIATLSNRIYSIRCSIVHSKENSSDFKFIPDLNDEIIKYEIPLIMYVASCVLENWTI